MNKLLAVLILLKIAASVANAAPRRVLVLPLDGNAEPALRAKLNLAVQKLARSVQGTVSLGDTTFSETAAAVGCDPAAPDCAETVRATLGVDELVWGTTTWIDGQTKLVVHRTAAKQPTRSASVMIGPQDTPEKADTTLSPLFGRHATPKERTGPVTTDPVTTEPVSDPVTTEPVTTEPARPETPPYDNRKRNTGIIVASGGGVVLLIGLALWSNKSNVQRDIDSAPTDTPADFARLEELESRASKYAWTGNVMVLVGAGVAAYGGWMIYQDRKERRIAIAPQVTTTAATVSVGGTW
ncbi:MAG: hypothetical protein H0T42_19220 [Deltaproteobacteria bacterium]|nr:hypothetical protein [Deltaproteobacteria bacterium]